VCRKFVLEGRDEFCEALHLALVFVDVLDGDDASRDLAIVIEDGGGAEADPCTGSIVVIADFPEAGLRYFRECSRSSLDSNRRSQWVE
jgi:hypothetical protein